MQKRDIVLLGTLTLIIFTITFGTLSYFGYVPNEFRIIRPDSKPNNSIKEKKEVLLPDRISISKIDVESVVLKPQSQEVKVLDESLRQGPVYYPGSGNINFGNMFIFGHSADRFTGVTNPAYKVFNNLGKLQKGDEIKIISQNKTYIYKVDTVEMVDENSALVEFTKKDRMLTISTCNTFGQAEDRFVVEAIFDREE